MTKLSGPDVGRIFKAAQQGNYGDVIVVIAIAGMFLVEVVSGEYTQAPFWHLWAYAMLRTAISVFGAIAISRCQNV